MLIFCSISLNSQDVLSAKELIKQYKIELELSEIQVAKFVSIIEKYSALLNKSDIDHKNFNKTNKLRDLEFYELLSKQQFDKYKTAKLKIEPTLKYRFN